MAAVALTLVVLATSCGRDGAEEAPTPRPAAGGQLPTKATPEPSQTRAAPPEAPQAAAFPVGIYLALPEPRGGASLWSLGGELPAALRFFGQGFDLRDDFVVTAEDRELVVLTARGEERRTRVGDLYAIARPSLSPDGRFVAVQATEQPAGEEQPRFLTIYVIDLESGDWRRVAPIMEQPLNGNELPEWLPDGRIAHWAIEGECLVIQVRDSASGELALTIRDRGVVGCYQPEGGVLDGPRFHIAASADGERLLVVGQMQIFDLATGELLSDLHRAVLDGLTEAGLRPDDRFGGQGGGGTVPLDGSFSPDGQRIVFDGAVSGPDGPAVMLFSIAIDGSGFEVIGGPYEVDPAATNDHNFSFLNPLWR